VIREFASPRLWTIFAVVAVLIYAGLYTWMRTTSKQHHRWLVAARLPLLAAGGALVVTVALVVFLTLFD
jgi:hypothetical protein